jgi:hypothetical protein
MNNNNNSSSSSRPLRKSKKTKKKSSSNRPAFIVNAQDTSMDRKTAQQALQLYRFTQSFALPIGNVASNPGGQIYSNPTSTATFIGSAASNITNDCMFALFFKLGDLPQSSSFTSLFDQYRIKRISVTFTPNYKQVGIQTASNAFLMPTMQMWYAVDYDDASAPSTLTALQEYSSIKMIDFNDSVKSHTVSFNPRVAIAANQAGAFTAYANQANQWLDAAYPNVQHYGLKFGFPCPNSVAYGIPPINIIASYDLEFREVR